jgi:hypothetical protein
VDEDDISGTDDDDPRSSGLGMTRSNFVTLIEQLRDLLPESSADRTAVGEAIKEQLPLQVIGVMKGHSGFKYVEVKRAWIVENGGERGVLYVSVSTNSSCECREMSSDPDYREMDEHQSKLEAKVLSFLRSLPVFVLDEVFGREERIRFYKWPTVRYAVAPFPASEW